MNDQPGRAFDPYIEQFEQAWGENGEIPEVADWFPESLRSTVPPLVLLELAEIDLEWRWRRRVAHRDWRYYARCFSLTDELTAILVHREFMVRSQWGDTPRIATVVDGHPQSASLQNKLAKLVWEQFEVQAEAFIDGLCVGKFDVPPTSVWGRQAAGEADPPSLTMDEDGVGRIIFARRSEQSISRRQFQLVRTGRRTFSLTTLSDKTGIYLVERSHEVTGEIEIVIPVSIGGSGWSIHFSET